MTPQYSIWLGGAMAALALLLAVVKLRAPANRWHRYGGRFSGFLGAFVLVIMVLRYVAFQVPISWFSLGHSLIGLIAFLFLIAKFLAFRRILVPPKYLRPLGFALTALFGVAGFGMIIPYFVQAASWKPLLAEEICREPDQASFNRVCISCHDRETAADDLGRRSIPDWIKLVEPMAWAGAKTREETRGALAAILEEGSRSSPIMASGVAMIATSKNVIDGYCLRCHDRQRITGAGRQTQEHWQRLISRMQKYSREKPGETPLADETLKKVLAYLLSKPRLAWFR